SLQENLFLVGLLALHMKLICANLRGFFIGAPVRSMGERGLSPPTKFPILLNMKISDSSLLRWVCLIIVTSSSLSVIDFFISSSSSDSCLQTSHIVFPARGMRLLHDAHIADWPWSYSKASFIVRSVITS